MKNRIATSTNFLRFFFFFSTFVCTGLMCVCPTQAISQNKNNKNLEKANIYFESKNWTLAIPAYKSYLVQHPDHVSARIKLGKALMNVDRLDDSLKEWTLLMENNNELPAEVYFLAGRSSHKLGLFSEAGVFYRSYVLSKKDGLDLELLSYYLKQVGSAIATGDAGSQYLVENAGPLVNSELDEFHPIYSPNIENRFYYSLGDKKVESPDRSASVKVSVMYAEVKQGMWQSQSSMDSRITHDKDIQLLDFSTDGMHMFFTTPANDGGTATYQKGYEDQTSLNEIPEWDHPIYKSNLGDRDLFLINDSAYLFSSDRFDGFGGYDLYVTFKRLGQWVVQNLGGTINSSYDEITPYLCHDGRSIFFSSNSDKSIGGYDIFFATFDDNMETWNTPSNMQSPINSGMNDVELRMSKDGSSAIFSSNRPQGYGGYDIYQVYLSQKMYSLNLTNHPRYFYQVQAFRSFSSENNFGRTMAEKPVYEPPILFFGIRPVVITPVIKNQLDELLEYGQLYPHMGLLFDIFTDQSWESGMNLYQPVLTLYNVTDYLKSHGLNPERIQLRLFGNQYPRYTDLKSSGDSNVESVRSLNRRLEFGFTNTENLPVQFGGSYSIPDQSEKISPYLQWKIQTEDLYFRVQIVESKQVLKGFEINDEKDLMLTIDEGSKLYTYYVGIYQHVASAREKLGQYSAQGFENAKIVAFLGNSRLAVDRITPSMIEAFPELKKYIIYQK